MADAPKLIEVRQDDVTWLALVIGDEAIISRLRTFDVSTNAQFTGWVEMVFCFVSPKRTPPPPPAGD